MIRRPIRDHLPGPGGTIALTFDDGPDPTFTPRVLDELERLDALATFFLVGERAAAHPALVQRIVAAGHRVGSHSHSHLEPGARGWRVAVDFVRGRHEVERAAGRRVRLFRPPKGYVSAREQWAMVAARVDPWLWTIDTEDWQPGATSGQVVAAVDALAPGDVVLLHDAICGPLAPEALDRSATVSAIDGIVAVARARGLELVTLGGDT